MPIIQPEKRGTYRLFLLGMSLLVILTLLVSVYLGSVTLAPEWVSKIIINHLAGRPVFPKEWKDSVETIIWNLRLPRALLAFIVGAGLTLSGVLMQALTKNQLADPYILGISSGASFGAVLMIMAPILIGLPALRVTLGAFAGAVISILITVRCAMIRNRMTPTYLVLSGVAVSCMFSALTNMMIYTSGDNNLRNMALFWMIGSLGGATWEQVITTGLICIGCALVIFCMAAPLDVLLMGEDCARTLGLNTTVIKAMIIILCTLMTGAVVSVSGVIGFVGLVVPHITRIFVGASHKRLLPASVLMGGMFVVLCDIVSRVLIAPEELHIGIVASCVGAPFFLWLLRHNSRQLGGQS